MVVLSGWLLHLLQDCKGFGIKDRPLEQVECAGAQGVERGCEIAAVYCGDDVGGIGFRVSMSYQL